MLVIRDNVNAGEVHLIQEKLLLMLKKCECFFTISGL